MTSPPRKMVPEIAKVMSAQFAMDTAERFHLNLDYSAVSIGKVEWMLSNHVQCGEGKFEQIFAVQLGYYIGEVIIRTLGGHWVRQSDVPVVVGVGGKVKAVFPVTKAIKRMLRGPEESLTAYYEEIVRERGT